VYLLGSVHVLKADNYPLPGVFESAFSNASVVVFETDIAAMLRPETQTQLMTQSELPNGQTLKDVLSTKTYAALTDYIKKAGLQEETIVSMRPGMAATMLVLQELQEDGYDPDKGMDLYFYQRCAKDGKTVRGLEPLEFQIGLLCGLSREEGEGIVKSTLKDLADAKSQFDDLLKAWQTGDSAALEKLLNDAQKEDPAVMKRILTDRNLKWAPQIEALAKGTNNAVVIVGAGHLVGKDGVVELLKQRGCKVSQE
jgi:uncharacterized protein YbaP (TraB family)